MQVLFWVETQKRTKQTESCSLKHVPVRGGLSSVVDGDKWESKSTVRVKGSARLPRHLGSLGRPLSKKTFE